MSLADTRLKPRGPGVYLKPLGHLSVFTYKSLSAGKAFNEGADCTLAGLPRPLGRHSAAAQKKKILAFIKRQPLPTTFIRHIGLENLLKASCDFAAAAA